MLDEVVQFLCVDLLFWFCGMVFSELFGVDLICFGFCYLVLVEVLVFDLMCLGWCLCEEFLLFDSQVDSGVEGFELVVYGWFEESLVLEVGFFVDEDVFIVVLL